MNRNIFVKILLLLVIVLVITLIAYEFLGWQQRDDNLLEISFLDVGQGDATLVNYLDQYQILIDGGPNGKALMTELAKEMPAMDRTIELVVLTHPDQDHLAGLIDVVERYQVDLFLDNGQVADTDIHRQLLETIERKGIERQMLAEGSKITVGEMVLRAFNPDELQVADKDRNDHSIVLRLDYGESSFLLMGDAEFSAEKDMMNDLEDLDVDWLKVGHHGSAGATSKEFLVATTPETAIISVGKDNRYGHPTEELLSRVREAGAKLLRTDEEGTIQIGCQNAQKQCYLIVDR